MSAFSNIQYHSLTWALNLKKTLIDSSGKTNKQTCTHKWSLSYSDINMALKPWLIVVTLMGTQNFSFCLCFLKMKKKKLPSLDYFTCQHHNRLLTHFLTNLNGKFDVVHVVSIMQGKSPLKINKGTTNQWHTPAWML